MGHQQELVSVLMPVYNAGTYLYEAIDSILKQTYTNLELLIINDGSSDDTRNIINNFTDPRIRYIENKTNKGLVFTLNKGLALAKGTYIARMDADDISLPDRLYKQISYLGSHPDVSVIGSWYSIIGTKEILMFPSTDNEIRIQFLKENVMAHPAVMFRKMDFKRFKLEYEDQFVHVEDYRFWTQASLHGLKFANLPEVLLLYRRHGMQVSSVHHATQTMMVDIVREEYAKKLYPQVLYNNQCTQTYLKLYNKKKLLPEEFDRLKTIVTSLCNTQNDFFDKNDLQNFLITKLAEVTKNYYRVFIPHRVSSINEAIKDKAFFEYLDIKHKLIFLLKCVFLKN